MTNLSRRNFLRASALGSVGLALGAASPSSLFARSDAAPQKRWYKGNLHMHNQWSDGKPLPEIAIAQYKEAGYDFVCPSDHNIFQSADLRFDTFGMPSPLKPGEIDAFKGETSFWKILSEKDGWPRLTQKYVDQATEKFGADSVRLKKVGETTYVRMKTFDELSEQFAEPGEFLMIPGFESTGVAADGCETHMNLINVRETFPYLGGATSNEILTRTFDKAVEKYSSNDEPYLFTANHPEWRFYDYQPSALIAMPQVRVFELLNNGLGAGNKEPESGAPWTPEKFWDVVNAWRASRDQRLLLGMGSDDRHNYESRSAGWSYVLSEKLDAPSLLRAIDAGDVYSSNGLKFKKIAFDGKTLEVEIDVEADGDYRIEFIGTKKDYDPTPRLVEIAKSATSPARTVEYYSDEIGRTLETVEGTSGSYTLKPDDLYVRAKICKVKADADADRWNARPAAWSQPFRG